MHCSNSRARALPDVGNLWRDRLVSSQAAQVRWESVLTKDLLLSLVKKLTNLVSGDGFFLNGA